MVVELPPSRFKTTGSLASLRSFKIKVCSSIYRFIKSVSITSPKKLSTVEAECIFLNLKAEAAVANVKSY
jgi:hypothetical protein